MKINKFLIIFSKYLMVFSFLFSISETIYFSGGNFINYIEFNCDLYSLICFFIGYIIYNNKFWFGFKKNN